MQTTVTNKVSTHVFVLLALILFGGTNIKAAPGDLDPTFGSGGKVVTQIVDYPYHYENSQSMLVQPDGKIVVCGVISDYIQSWDVSFYIVRYHPTGALDDSFGTNGKIIAPYNGGSYSVDIALQADGKIIAAGQTGNDNAVQRYHANGTLDASFGTGGVVIMPVSAGYAQSVAVRADGKIVVAAYGNHFTVVRYNPDGSLDTSFNGTGIVLTSFGAISYTKKVVLQPDGKIVALGDAVTGDDTRAFALVRLNADGSLDSAFGAGGKVIHAVSNGISGVGDAVLQPDGKIVVSGWQNYSMGTSETAIVRYNPNGSIDTSFAANGIFTTETNFNVSNGITLQPDGKLVAFGSESSLGGFAVLRLNPNGTPDAGFGNNGRVTTQIGAHPFTKAVDGAVQPDGKILAFGENSTYTDIAIVRYLGDSAAPLRTNGKIAFTSDRDGNREIYVMNRDGSGQVRLTDNAIVDDHAEWSPDGKRIAFLSQRASGAFAIFVMNADGTGKTEVTPVSYQSQSPWRGFDNWTMSWSPDGGQIVFSEGAPASGTLFIVNADGSNRRSLTTGFFPAWSPDGSKILFLKAISGVSLSLNTIRPDGTNLQNIPTPGLPSYYTVWDTPPVWSPDGRKFAYSATDFANSEIYIANPDGTNPQYFLHICAELVPEGCGFNTAYPAWSPNGRTIAFANYGYQSGMEIYVKNVGEDAILRLTDTSGNNSHPSWQPLNRTIFDFDGDARADVSVFRPGQGEWWYRQSANGEARAAQFGNSSDKIVPADFTGDGKTDIAVWRDSTGEWFILRSENNSFFSFPFGTTGDIPAPADFDGDGRADAAVFRPSTATWYVLNSGGGTAIVDFGAAEDKPVPADYDGDGKTDIAIFRSVDGSWWYLQSSDTQYKVYRFGVGTDKPVQGDYTGDGKIDLAVFRPSTGEWFVQRSEDNSYFSFFWGQAGDIPVPGDYDGDSKFDAAVFRPSNSTWYLNQTTSGVGIVQFGSAGDKPVPHAFVP